MSRASEITLAALTRHESFVRALARSLVVDPNEANDLQQETWLALLRRGSDPPGSRVWLGGVLRRVAFSRRRAERRRAAREGERSSPESEAGRTLSTQHRVVAAVLELEEPYRETVLLRFYRGETPREIAERLDAPIETVRTRLKRALTKLRDALDADFGGREAWATAIAPLALRQATSRLPLVAAAAGVGVAVVVGARAWTGGVPSGELSAGTPAVASAVAPTSKPPSTEPDSPGGSDARPSNASTDPAAARRALVGAAAPAAAASADPVQVAGTDEDEGARPDAFVAARDAYWAAVLRAREGARRFVAAEHLPQDDARLLEAVADARLPHFRAHEPTLGRVIAVLADAAALPLEVDAPLLQRTASEGASFRLELDRPVALTVLLDLVVAEAGRDVVWYARDRRIRVSTAGEADWQLVRFSHSIADLLVDPRDYFDAGARYHPIFDPPEPGLLATMMEDASLSPYPDWTLAVGEADFEVLDTPRGHENRQAFLDLLRRFFAPGPGGPGRAAPGTSQVRYRGDESRELLARIDAVRFAEGPASFAGVEDLARHLARRLDANAYATRALVRALGRRPWPSYVPPGSVGEVLDALESLWPELRWSVGGGILRLATCGEYGADVFALYDLRSALEPPGLGAEDLGALPELAERLEDGEVLAVPHLMTHFVQLDPESWDESPEHRMALIDGVLFVDQHPRVQRGIAALVERLERAADRRAAGR